MKKSLLILLLFPTALYSQEMRNVKPVLPNAVVNKPLHDPPEIINKYTEVLLFDECNNAVTVSDDSLFNVGDTVLLIQMKGAIIDTSNTTSFGMILDYKNAGNYEFNYISSKSGNKLAFKNRLTKNYDIPSGVVQLIRVPFLTNPNFFGGLTCMRWDGTKGGVLAVITKNGLTCSWDIDVSGMGFRGGEGYNAVLPASNCFENNYYNPSASQLAAFKGESIASLSQNINKGKGSPSGGGGGGLSHNSGGGGGGNAGTGGFGGYQSDTCGNAPFDNRGIGGKNLLYNASANKIFMGSGGGAGHTDNNSVPPSGGGAGGGIAIIITDSLYMYTHQILSNGFDGKYCYSPDCNDGMGGGGAGGTILMSLNKIIDTVTIITAGGNGAHVTSPVVPGGRVGPGGGGGGGAFFMNSSSLPANATLINNYGINGYIVTNSANPWGATKGTSGLSFFNLVLPFDTVLFKTNIDSVRIIDSLVTCNSFNFKGFAFTNTNPISSWYWDFNDGNIANTQNTSHTYLSGNTFSVKLIATDINGCKDSITDIIIPKIVNIDAGQNRSFCSNTTVTVTLNGSGTGIYAWAPALYLNDPAQQNPVATIDTTTTFYLTITSTTNNCPVTDSVKIIVNTAPLLRISKSNDINCTLPYTKLKVTGAMQYLWSPESTLTSSSMDNPIANPSVTTTYFVTASNNNGCSAKDSITVIVDFLEGNILLPNSFTPNGDGLNDCFGIKYYRDVQNLTLIIYNRFGEKVFETKNAAECWNGNYKGQQLDQGTYVYYISAKTLCGTIIRKGSILLIR